MIPIIEGYVKEIEDKIMITNDIETKFQKIEKDYLNYLLKERYNKLEKYKDIETKTTDGYKIKLYSNIGLPVDIKETIRSFIKKITGECDTVYTAYNRRIYPINYTYRKGHENIYQTDTGPFDDDIDDLLPDTLKGII